MGRSPSVLLSILILLSALGTATHAEIPRMISYQGKVTDVGGTPIADGIHTMRFRIYDAETVGTMLWDSGDRTVAVAGGIFCVLIGENPQPALSLDFSQDYWLDVTVDGDVQTPRVRMASAGYAYMASGLVAGTEVSGAVTGGTNAAIKGSNTATEGTTQGVYGSSSSPFGSGLYGSATATEGTTYGVLGASVSTSGRGVYGHASATEGTTYGGRFVSDSPSGRGVYGEAFATTGTNYGVYGWSRSPSGNGVYGEAAATTGTTQGVSGMSLSTAGRAVYGAANATAGTTYGGRFVSASTSGRGVYGYAYATTGTTYGVYGVCNSSSGYGGYFDGRLRAAAAINTTATPENHVGQIYNTSAGTSPDVLALKVGYTGNPGSAINYITFFNGNDTPVGAIEGDGAGGVTLLSGSGDFAEYLPRLPGEELEPGDVVGVFDGNVAKRTDGASQVMVVSTRPIVVGNSPGEDKAGEYARVAFIGQVEVNVRGSVRAGDLLMPSGMGDGTAVAVSGEEISAEQFRQVFGQAWEGSGDGGVKRIRAAVGLLRHDPSVARLEAENKTLRVANTEMQAAITALQRRVAVLEESR